MVIVENNANTTSTSNNIKVSTFDDTFTRKLFSMYGHYEDEIDKLLNDRNYYENPDYTSEDAVRIRGFYKLHDQYCDLRALDPDVARGLLATCCWYYYQFIENREVEFTRLGTGDKLELLYDPIVDYLIGKYCIVTHNDKIYIFDGKTSGYVEDVEGRQIRQEIDALFKRTAFSFSRATVKIINEIVTKIAYRSAVFTDPFNQNSANMIPVANGVVYRKNGIVKLLPKSPAWGFIYSLPVKYDGSADETEVQNFLQSVAVDDDVESLVQIPAQALLQNENYQLSYLLTGHGSNGKSTYINLVTKLLGTDNTTSISLQEIAEDRFKTAELYGKLANLYADLPKTALKTTGQFKILTGGDTLLAQRKFGHPFKMVNKAVFVFSANELPEVNDATFAFWRRWAIIDFPHQFDVDPEFPKRLLTEQNLSAFLNIVIDKIDEIERDGRVKRSKNADKIAEEWQSRCDNVHAFAVQRLVVDENEVGVDKTEVFNRYVEFCKLYDFTALSRNKFFERLNQHVPIREAKIGGRGETKQRLLRGLRFKTTSEIAELS